MGRVDVCPGGGGGEEKFCAVQIAIAIVVSTGDEGEVSCDVKGNTYNSVLTVQVVRASVAISGASKAGELLGTLAGVHPDSVSNRVVASGHHDPVLKFNSTSSAG